MLQAIDRTSAFLSYDGTEPIKKGDEELLNEEIVGLYGRWDDEIRFALGEVQLIASPYVAEVADRSAWALMLLIGAMDSRKTWLGDVDTRKTFQEVNQAYYLTLHLIEALRNEMRKELGFTDPVHSWPRSKEWTDWPWLSDKPDEQDKASKAENS